MVLDADDWVDRDLVAAARAGIGEDHVGALDPDGLAVDFRTRCAAPLPHPALEGLPFHRFCGSCGVVLIRPDAATEIRRDPFAVLRSHHRWVEVAQEHGESLARLPVSGAYLINTGENHSDTARTPCGMAARFHCPGEFSRIPARCRNGGPVRTKYCNPLKLHPPPFRTFEQNRQPDTSLLQPDVDLSGETCRRPASMQK